MSKITVAFGSVVFVAGMTFFLMFAVESKGGIDDASKNDLKNVCEDSISKACQGDIDGWLHLLENSVMAATIGENDKNYQASQAMKQIHTFRETYGSFLGCSLVKEKQVGDTLRQYVFLARFEKNVSRWTFVLYRPRDQWKILGFNSTGDSQAIFSLFD